ncbi:FIST signal transduction protein [Roseomonas sp. GCM10028921]
MRCEQRLWTAESGWSGSAPNLGSAGLVLYFGSRDALASGERHRDLQVAYPGAQLLGCSTGGQIVGDAIDDDAIVAIAVKFDATRVRLAAVDVRGPDDSEACGEALGQALRGDDLAGIFLLSDGLHVNGSGLAAGLRTATGPAVPISGGLAGDGSHFRATLVGAGDAPPREKRVAAVGLYGTALRLGHGSGGGWESFGPSRQVTRSEGSRLLELDGQPALDLYERYLGEEAKGLPGTALLYPLRIWDASRPQHGVVRTVLGVDRSTRTMTFAGDIPQGWMAQLMHGRFDQLVAGAADASTQATQGSPRETAGNQQLAVLVSCIGRRLVMGQAITDEIIATVNGLTPGTVITGFYSYGELAPHAISGACELHNQSMTVTILSEAEAC